MFFNFIKLIISLIKNLYEESEPPFTNRKIDDFSIRSNVILNVKSARSSIQSQSLSNPEKKQR